MAFTQPLPVALSPSRLADFQSCPRRYQLGAVERLPQPPTYALVKGRFIHVIFELLFRDDAQTRTPERAREFFDQARENVIDGDVLGALGEEEPLFNRLAQDSLAAIDAYFSLEDPRAIRVEGVEMRVEGEVEGAPLLGIIDRLDRDESGQLTIVDYKTGKVPDRRFDSSTFANTELYAALCQATTRELPHTIRLIYVGHTTTLTRHVSEVVIQARARSAATAWSDIVRYYDQGEFPARPSQRACRFCAFTQRCRDDGVAVPIGVHP